jgi:hypothetical protein
MSMTGTTIFCAYGGEGGIIRPKLTEYRNSVGELCRCARPGCDVTARDPGWIPIQSPESASAFARIPTSLIPISS